MPARRWGPVGEAAGWCQSEHKYGGGTSPPTERLGAARRAGTSTSTSMLSCRHAPVLQHRRALHPRRSLRALARAALSPRDAPRRRAEVLHAARREANGKEHVGAVVGGPVQRGQPLPGAVAGHSDGPGAAGPSHGVPHDPHQGRLGLADVLARGPNHRQERPARRPRNLHPAPIPAARGRFGPAAGGDGRRS